MGLLTFVDNVKAKLASMGVDANITIGPKEPARQNNQGAGTANRIVFVPKGGNYDAAVQPGRNPRPLHTLMENVDVYVWAKGATTPGSPQPTLATDMENYSVCWDLKENLMIAMRRVGYGTYKLGALRHINNEKIEKITGWEMVFSMVLQVPVMDKPLVTALVTEIEAEVQAVDSEGNVIGP